LWQLARKLIDYSKNCITLLMIGAEAASGRRFWRMRTKGKNDKPSQNLVGHSVHCVFGERYFTLQGKRPENDQIV
jgi:hypothetical protein